MLDADGTLGATYTPDCAAIHPLRLARGLADSLVRGAGSPIHEHTRATELAPGRAVTPTGRSRAGTVVRATEGYTGAAPGPPAGSGAGLLAGDRDRAAARRDVGADRAGAAARRSPTTGT